MVKTKRRRKKTHPPEWIVSYQVVGRVLQHQVFELKELRVLRFLWEGEKVHQPKKCINRWNLPKKAAGVFFLSRDPDLGFGEQHGHSTVDDHFSGNFHGKAHWFCDGLRKSFSVFFGWRFLRFLLGLGLSSFTVPQQTMVGRPPALQHGRSPSSHADLSPERCCCCGPLQPRPGSSAGRHGAPWRHDQGPGGQGEGSVSVIALPGCASREGEARKEG